MGHILGNSGCNVRMFYARIDHRIFNINQYLGLMKFQIVRLHGYAVSYTNNIG